MSLFLICTIKYYNMCTRPIGMDLMDYYRLLKKIRIYWESGEDGLYGKIMGVRLSNPCIH